MDHNNKFLRSCTFLQINNFIRWRCNGAGSKMNFTQERTFENCNDVDVRFTKLVIELKKQRENDCCALRSNSDVKRKDYETCFVGTDQLCI